MYFFPKPLNSEFQILFLLSPIPKIKNVVPRTKNPLVGKASVFNSKLSGIEKLIIVLTICVWVYKTCTDVHFFFVD